MSRKEGFSAALPLCHLAQASEPLWAPGSSSTKWNLWVLFLIQWFWSSLLQRGSGGGGGEHLAHQHIILVGFFSPSSSPTVSQRTGCFVCLFQCMLFFTLVLYTGKTTWRVNTDIFNQVSVDCVRSQSTGGFYSCAYCSGYLYFLHSRCLFTDEFPQCKLHGPMPAIQWKNDKD